MVDNWMSRCLKTCLSISSLRKRGPKEKEKLKKKKKERRRKKEKKTNLRKKTKGKREQKERKETDKDGKTALGQWLLENLYKLEHVRPTHFENNMTDKPTYR